MPSDVQSLPGHQKSTHGICSTEDLRGDILRTDPRRFPEEPMKIWTHRRELDIVRPPLLPWLVAVGSVVAVVTALAIAFVGGL